MANKWQVSKCAPPIKCREYDRKVRDGRGDVVTGRGMGCRMSLKVEEGLEDPLNNTTSAKASTDRPKEAGENTGYVG